MARVSLTPDEREFRRRYAGRRLIIIGGQYRPSQAQVLCENLGILLDQHSWLAPRAGQALHRLRNVMRPGCMVLIFTKYNSHAVTDAAKQIAQRRGVRVVRCPRLAPAAVANAFLRFA